MALLTKHSAALLIPILCLLAAVEAWLEKSDTAESARATLRNLGAVVAILVIAAAIVWCGYGLRYSGDTSGASAATPEKPVARMNSADVSILKAMRAGHLMPQPYLDGLIDARVMVANGIDAYILGRYYPETPWFFYPLTTTIKFTVGFLVMLILGGWGIVVIGRQRRTEILFLLLPALMYLAASLRVKRTSGIWHLFPLLPFLLIAAAAGCVYLARRYRWGRGALVCLLALHAVSSLRAYPNYLSYANELWGGPQNLYQHLPETDLGQSFWQVSRYMEQHPGTPCWLENSFLIPSDPYKVPCTRMGDLNVATDVPEHMKGIVFVSSTWLQLEGQRGGPLAPFYAVEPTARLGGSAVLVYEGDFDTRVAAARALDIKVGELMEKHNPVEALRLAERGAELAPANVFARNLYGLMLVLNGRTREGLGECAVSRALALAGTGPRNQQMALEIARQMQSISQGSGVPLPPGAE
jgi:hypothetical protein